MIKAGLIGCGKISTSQIAAIEASPDANITAVCDTSEERLAAICEKTGAVGYTDYKELLDKEDIDLAIISLPHFLHGEATCYAAERGIDIFLEKPMGISVADCEKMIETCKRCGVMLWVGHSHRYIESYRRAKELADSGELGELVCFSETRNVDYFADSRPRWFLKKELSGGGIMINLGAHCLDKMKYFFDSEIESISGNVHIREGFDVEDSVQAFVRMKNGGYGTVNLVGTTAAHMNPTVLYLTKGEIRISTSGAVEYCGEDGAFKKEEHSGSGMKNQLEDVIRVMQTLDKKPVVTGEYGLDIIRAIKTLYGEI